MKLHGMWSTVLMKKNRVYALKVKMVRHHWHVHVAYLSVLVFVVHVHQATSILISVKTLGPRSAFNCF